MVIRTRLKSRRQCGALMTELMVALAILAGVLLPLAYSLVSERELARSSYQRAVAMEIVDGEMEALVAGEWRAFAPGTQEYRVRATAMTNLPPGKFLLTLEPGHVRLKWQPAVKQHGGAVVREARVK